MSLARSSARRSAARRATSEVAWPVIGSTVTTLVAFFPMLFWPGIMGEFMKYLPITVIVTLSSSLFVAVVINPAMASIHMKLKGGPDTTGMTIDEISAAVDKPAAIQGFWTSLYARSLTRALEKPWSVLGLTLCGMILMFQAWLLIIGLEKPVEFFPEVDPKGMYVNVETPEGADLDYIDRVMQRVELAVAGFDPGAAARDRFDRADYLRAMAPREHTMPSGLVHTAPGDLANIRMLYMKGVVAAGPGSAFDSNTPSHLGIRFLDLQDRNERSQTTLDTIRRRVAEIPGAKVTIATEEQGPPTGAPINIEIIGDDFAVLGETARHIRRLLADLPHVSDIRDDFNEGLPSVQVRVDRQKAALFGLTTNAIGFALKTAYNGLDVSTYREGNDDYDITVQLAEGDRRTVDVLNELLIPAPDGRLVPLSTLATVRFAGALVQPAGHHLEQVVVGEFVRQEHQQEDQAQQIYLALAGPFLGEEKCV